VGPGIVVEVKGSELRVSGIDAHVFPTEEQERWPEEIRKEGGRQKHGERSARRKFFGCEADGEVADKHFVLQRRASVYICTRIEHAGGGRARISESADSSARR
jgi:hypothetical protein